MPTLHAAIFGHFDIHISVGDFFFLFSIRFSCKFLFGCSLFINHKRSVFATNNNRKRRNKKKKEQEKKTHKKWNDRNNALCRQSGWQMRKKVASGVSLLFRLFVALFFFWEGESNVQMQLIVRQHEFGWNPAECQLNVRCARAQLVCTLYCYTSSGTSDLCGCVELIGVKFVILVFVSPFRVSRICNEYAYKIKHKIRTPRPSPMKNGATLATCNTKWFVYLTK